MSNSTTTGPSTTGPSTTPARPTRERLLQAASELFYREGTVAVGVDKICQQAQVSKRSLYQLFGTKDELVAASLRQTGEALTAQYLPSPDGGPGSGGPGGSTPRDRILSVFRWLETAASEAGFAGCPFVNAATELKDAGHPGAVVARRFKQQLTDFFESEATAAGFADPTLLAQQLTITFDGCSARVIVAGRTLEGLAVVTATALLDAAPRRSDEA